MRKLRNDLVGQTFGRLTVISRAENKGKAICYLCQCECGNIKTVRANNLLQGSVRSCGCLSKEIAPERGEKSKIGERSTKHGDFGTKLYGVWAGMKRRCNNPNTRYYERYGGRGIRVCDEWNEYETFKQWAIESGYHEGLTIDRIDNDKNYSPDNCRWVNAKKQQNNRSNNILITIDGQNFTAEEAAKALGISTKALYERLRRKKQQ